MSSYRKDARWAVAAEVCKAAGLDFYALEYIELQRVLDAADTLIMSIPYNDGETLRVLSTWGKP